MLGTDSQPETPTTWTPNSDQIAVLGRVYDHYRLTRKWPKLSALCYQLRHDAKDPEAIIAPIPGWVARTSNLVGWTWDSPQGHIALTIEGMRFTSAGMRDLEAFVRVLHALCTLADQHSLESLADEPIHPVTDEQVAEELQKEGTPLDRDALCVAGAILLESSGIADGGSYGEAFQTWTARVNLARLIPFREIDSVHALLNVRRSEAEKRGHALAAMSTPVITSRLQLGGLQFRYQPEAEVVTIQSSQGHVDPNFIFVVMPFGEPWTDQVYGWIRSVVLDMRNSRPGLNVKRSGEQRSDGPWITAIHRFIRRAAIVVCDLTGNNPNCLYELGFAHGCNRSTIILTQSDISIVPSDIKAVELAWRYNLENEPAFRTMIRERLVEALGDSLTPE